MKRRNWKPEDKLKIVIEGLRGDVNISELCNRHQISQAQYYQWKDKLLGDGHKLFSHGGVDKHADKLEEENRQLKEIIGELHVELKKNDF